MCVWITERTLLFPYNLSFQEKPEVSPETPIVDLSDEGAVHATCCVDQLDSLLPYLSPVIINTCSHVCANDGSFVVT
jgi:hypothetical protein